MSKSSRIESTLESSVPDDRGATPDNRSADPQCADSQAADSQAADWQSSAWASLASGLVRRFRARPLSAVFCDWQFESPRQVGSALRAGLAIGQGTALEPVQIAVTDLAAGIEPDQRPSRALVWNDAAEELIRTIDFARSPGKIDPSLAVDAVCWAYALPALIERLSETTWKSLCQSLDALARHGLSYPDPASVGRLIAGCELALALRWRLGDVASETLAQQGIEGLQHWCENAEVSIANAVRGNRYARMVLASVLRQRRVAEQITKKKIKRRELGTAVDLACWVAALTRRDGTAVLSPLKSRAIRDDLVRGGVLDAMTSLAPKLLRPAVDATLGVSQSGGKLAWAVSLPESLWHSELAGVAAMLPEWDVRRGRTYVDYASEDFLVEVEYGRGAAIAGKWEAMIEVDGVEQAAAGPWTHVCEYSDDDVQYLEFEQCWTGGVRLQRQIMVLRDDRCVLLADAVLRDNDQPSAKIDYVGRTPIAAGLVASFEDDTHEIWLRAADDKRRALVLSLQTNEWRVGPSAAKIAITEDQHLKLQATSQPPRDNGGSLFAPLWFDFQQRRFNRPRTYRQLTVGDELRIVDQDEAVAQRVQMGSEHWVVYRSLCGERTRTFLGKHLVADFYCARFHPSDGSLEDLLTVGDHDEDIARAEAEGKIGTQPATKP